MEGKKHKALDYGETLHLFLFLPSTFMHCPISSISARVHVGALICTVVAPVGIRGRERGGPKGAPCSGGRPDWFNVFLCSSGAHFESGLFVSGALRPALCPSFHKTPSDYDILLPPQGSCSPCPPRTSPPWLSTVYRAVRLNSWSAGSQRLWFFAVPGLCLNDSVRLNLRSPRPSCCHVWFYRLSHLASRS